MLHEFFFHAYKLQHMRFSVYFVHCNFACSGKKDFVSRRIHKKQRVYSVNTFIFIQRLYTRKYPSQRTIVDYYLSTIICVLCEQPDSTGKQANNQNNKDSGLEKSFTIQLSFMNCRTRKNAFLKLHVKFPTYW